MRRRAPALAVALVLAGSTPPLAQQCPAFRVAPCVPVAVVQPEDPGCGGLCEPLRDQLERGCAAGADQPYADTVFLRRPGTAFGGDEVRSALALAALAETPEGVASIVAPLMTAEDPRLRYAGALHLALAAVRAGQAGDARMAEALEVMAAAETPDDLPRSDLAFLRALRAEAEGRPAEALVLAQEAVAIEPRFFNALALELRLSLAQGDHLRGAADPFSRPETCREEFRRMLTALARIADLEPCPRVAAHLELYLSRQLRVPEAAPGLRAAQVYLGVLSRRGDLARGALDGFLRPPRPVCAPEVAAELEGLLGLLDAADEP